MILSLWAISYDLLGKSGSYGMIHTHMVDDKKDKKKDKKEKEKKDGKLSKHAAAVIGIALIAMGEDIGR